MFDRAAVEARLADAGSYVLMDHETADRFVGAFHADLRATLAALDAATARVRKLEDAVRDYIDDRNHAEFCAVNYRALCTCGLGRLQLALAPATGEENG